MNGEFARAGTRMLQLMARFKRTLSPRDFALLAIGMRASHIEEALSQGDVVRAQGHFDRLAQALQDLPDR